MGSVGGLHPNSVDLLRFFVLFVFFIQHKTKNQYKMLALGMLLIPIAFFIRRDVLGIYRYWVHNSTKE